MKKYIFLSVSIIILGALGFGSLKFTIPNQPQKPGGALSQIKENVTVKYDDFGIPHIYAENSGDAHFALGFVMGEIVCGKWKFLEGQQQGGGGGVKRNSWRQNQRDRYPHAKTSDSTFPRALLEE